MFRTNSVYHVYLLVGRNVSELNQCHQLSMCHIAPLSTQAAIKDKLEEIKANMDVYTGE